MSSDKIAADSPSTDWGALFLLLWLPASAALCLVGVQLYLHQGPKPPTALMVAGQTLFIYALNGLSDEAEDSVNDAKRAATLRRTAWWILGAATSVMLVSGSLLAVQGRLHLVYLAVTLVGVAYSFRVIPCSSSGRGNFEWVRLKDVLFVKNLTIGVTWGTAVFVVPMLDHSDSMRAPTALVLIGISYVLLVTENSIFCDLRDELGDRQAGVRTLAVRFGPSRCQVGILGVALIWCAVLIGCLALGVVDARTVTFLALLSLLYPAAVSWTTNRESVHQRLANALIESFDLVFAVGLFALSI